MTAVRKAEDLLACVRDAADGTGDTSEFRRAVLDGIRAGVPFDRGCIGMVDPATLMLTSATMVDVDDPLGRAAGVVAELEYGSGPYANTYGRLARTPTGVQTIRDGIEGEIREALPYLEILEPMGMVDEVRLVFRGRDGCCWGVGTLMRGPGRMFDHKEVRILARCAREIGEGLRLSLVRQAPRVLAEVSAGPAVVIVGPDDEVESATPVALEFLERVVVEPRLRMLPVVSAAVRLRTSGRAVFTRARTVDGRWLVIRAGRFDGRGPAGRVVVTLEPAGPAEVVSLLTAIHGLTEREAAVLGRVLLGETRVQIGERLFISPYTVQDHLKSIYAKTGVNSRQELLAQLFYTHYLPRYGEPVGPGGWFAGDPVRAAHSPG
ncbi:putative transcriptional regulator [Rhodococcus aetherivorans]|uniref:Transcriptional regulator n=1 Tax=Rhodococcus aetherivorans TaxID=191292 RepID=A0ABQ0YTL8_9NOCA|nr:helix-turn-helix transcriptional regulator [Rhodococcus aetherivorans]ETT25533.1 transcriptional regulator, LuxR family [Rhodococcus rhodochrous ATCC 21198]NGP29797.1 helix-turn-helix transcriptional regulator [Rhodococcus aetherivorans]GES39949.1 putative transcriptional regulator [Rhodococcus aetherivorans]